MKQRIFDGIGHFASCAAFWLAMLSPQVSWSDEGIHWVNSGNDVSGVFNVASQELMNDKQVVYEARGTGSYIPSLNDVTINGFATERGVWGAHTYLPVASATRNLVIPETLSYHRGGNLYTGTVRCLDYECFKGFDNLVSVSIPSTIRIYSQSLFANCTSLQSVELRCNTISPSMFRGCTSLRRINIPEGVVTNICAQAFEDSGLVEVSVPWSVRDIGTSAFNGCADLTSVVIAEGVQTIGEQAFRDCTALCSIGMPQSIDIDRSAFKGCTGLSTVDIPNYARVQSSAFYGCSGLTNLHMHKGVQIENGAFSYCSGLKTLYVENAGESDGETVIHYMAFTGCGSLESIFVTGNAPTIDGGSYGATYLYGVPSSCTVYVPRGSSGWGVDIPGKWYGLNIAYYTPPTLPDLSFSLTPRGWSAPVVVSASAANATNCTATTFKSTDNLYVCRAVYCTGNDVNTTFYTRLLIDGIERQRWSLVSLQKGSYNGLKGVGYCIGTLPAGTHTIRLEADCTGVVAESNEGNNVYTKTITVTDNTTGPYTIRFNKNDGTGTAASKSFTYGTKSRLPLVKSGLGWARGGYVFRGWATSAANAAAGKVWKDDWAVVSTAAQPGKTLNVYAVWELDYGYYQIRFNKNDGSGAWRTVAFPYGADKTLPSCKGGLGWTNDGYAFVGWSISAAKAGDPSKASNIWKPDQCTVSQPVEPGTTLDVYASWVKGYTIRFHKNTGAVPELVKAQGFRYGVETRLPALKNGLSWARDGFTFKGWATSLANAGAGKIWRGDWAYVTTAASVGQVLNVWAVWGKGAAASGNNDNFANATVISGASGSVTGSNVGATVEAGEPLVATYSGAKNSVWWAWTAPFSGSVTFTTVGTGFDTVMGVYTGSSLSSLTAVAEDDDSGGNRTSACTFAAKEGTVYRIAVSGYNENGVGAITLSWSW